MKKLQATSPDRISALPEPIIHNILSRLPTKSAKLASSLSKTWYDFCSSFPYLDFDDESMYVDDTLKYFFEEDDFNPNFKSLYLNYICETLRKFHERNPRIVIRRIRISITIITSTFVSLLGDSIRLALEHGVEKIDLITRGNCFDLPGEVFTSNSIQVLKFEGCSLLKSFCDGDIGVSRSKLRMLVITRVSIDELALSSIISMCPLIEKLAIEDVMGLSYIHISHHYKLKSLVVSDVSGDDLKAVEVDAPMLHCLKIASNTSFGQSPHIKIGILECPRLAKLTLSDVGVENFQLEEILSRLPLLSCLRLCDLILLTKFKISSDSLNQLAIVRCTHLLELEINAPNLLSFEFECNCVPLVGPIHTIMGQSYITLDIGLLSYYDNFAVRFSNFLLQLDRVNYLCFYLKAFPMISIDDLANIMQPVTDIEELKIILKVPISLQDIFNGLLRSVHPRILTMHLELFKNSGVMKFLRDIMVSSWLPYLEGITIVASDDDDNVIRLPMDGTVPSFALKSYFWGEIKFEFKW